MEPSEDLLYWKRTIEGHARAYGLDFFETRFEVLDYRQLNEVASYGGFPVRYSHWSHGMQFDQLSKSYAYGLQKIYEMVINNDPCYAYLMKENNLVDQKLVMCHVYGHCDFFKNNIWFSKTNRQMINEMANHASRIRTYINRHGLEEVEAFLDQCLSLEHLIDVHSQFITRRRQEQGELEQEQVEDEPSFRFKAKPYMEEFINPDQVVQRRRKEYAEKRQEKVRPEFSTERDILLFLMERAPLKRWQRDVLGMVRDEAYYFAPQWQTKIMNEGWAVYWHSTLMTQKVLNDAEVIDYADHHSGTLGGSGSTNPYKLGYYLFKDIEERWNKGKFGPEYDRCSDFRERAAWDRRLGLGREKIFEVRRIYNDVTFIDTFLTEEFCQEHKLFVYQFDLDKDQYVVASREFRKIKQQLLTQLTNASHPLITIVDEDYLQRGGLLLRHGFEGIPLDIAYAQDTLRSLHGLWQRPVAVETVYKDRPIRITFDGETPEVQEIAPPKPVDKH
jgi:stage V sporulation protein R